MERGIIFSGPMVKAVLEGRKTQTRRVIRPQPEETEAASNNVIVRDYCTGLPEAGLAYYWKSSGCWNSTKPLYCPYGQIGDRLYVRETRWRNGGWVADGPSPLKNDSKIPSIFMKKIYARIWLEITNIRVERVQKINKEDTKAEGVIIRNIGETYWRAFKTLWDSINAKRGICKTCKGHQIIPKWVGTPEGGDLMQSSQDCPDCNGETGYGWDKNPWVWVIDFKAAAQTNMKKVRL